MKEKKMTQNNSDNTPEELDGLASEARLSRRRFMGTTLAAGFALAVRPVQAQTVIRTGSEGLVAGEVKVPVADGQIPAYRAMPENGGPFPVLLVVQEIFGVHEHIKDLCRRFARLGHFAIAPELFARQGDVSQAKDPMTIIREVVSKVPDAQVMGDLDAAVAYARQTGQGDTGKLGITGFCWGGRIVWLYAAHNPQLDAGAAWYGRLAPAEPAPADALHPLHPIDVADKLKAPVIGFYAGRDRGIPLESVERMRAALQKQRGAAGSKSQIIVYPEAEHGFNADYRPSYNKAASEDANRRLREWFKQHGAA